MLSCHPQWQRFGFMAGQTWLAPDWPDQLFTQNSDTAKILLRLRIISMMNLSDILKEVGNEGLFQILTLLVLTMPKMPIQWSMTMMSYASYSPKWCCVPQDVVVDTNCETFQSGNSSVISYKSSYQQCHLNSTECDHRVYLAPDGAQTAVTEVSGFIWTCKQCPLFGILWTDI